MVPYLKLKMQQWGFLNKCLSITIPVQLVFRVFTVRAADTQQIRLRNFVHIGISFLCTAAKLLVSTRAVLLPGYYGTVLPVVHRGILSTQSTPRYFFPLY